VDALTIPKDPTSIKLVPTATVISRAPANIRDGTIRKPPPMPKKPDRKPTAKPVGIKY